MCNPIHGIRFCTCEEVNKDSNMSYWQLYRKIAGEQLLLVGTPAYFGMPPTQRAPWLRRIRKALDTPTVFDFEYIPHDGDHLSVHIVNHKGREHFEYPLYEFGYTYSKGKWRYKAYDSFIWRWEQVDVEMGCVGVKG